MNITDAHAYIGQGKHLTQTIDTLLRHMDEAEISYAIVCPVDHYLAVHNVEGNNIIIDAVRNHPGRLLGMAVANPWFGEKAAAEVHRALEQGLHGLFIHSVYQGFRLNDHIVDPLLDVAAEFDVPVYAHTGTAGIAEPFHVAELARRYPSLNFIMGHAGSSDYGEDAVRALEFADNIWLETSRNGPANYGLWKIKNIVSRVVFGSSTPEYIPEIEIETLCDVFITGEERDAVLSSNIVDVFKGRFPV